MAPPGSRDDSIGRIGRLVGYFTEGAKSPEAFRVGIEQEKLAVRSDGSPVPQDGPDGIAELFRRLVERRGFVAQLEDGRAIALARGDDRITLEPGGQVEFSGAALPTAMACRAALLAHVAEVSDVGRPLDIRFISGGFRPFGGIDDVPWFTKRRYVVMRDYLPRVGRLGHEMMKRTATVQANLDFADEHEAADKMRTALALSPLMTAMFASSPVSEGRPNGHLSYRAAVWLDVDEARCGILPFAFKPGFGFRDYVEWALDVPMFFLVRAGRYQPVGGMTFRRFLGQGWHDEAATMADWEIHLSTLFPEVRLKRYIEVRSADAAPLPIAAGLGALWRGLLDHAPARQAAFALVANASLDERERLRREVPRAGLAARIAGRALSDLAPEICRIARQGLVQLPGGGPDQALLDPLVELAAAKRCPADDMLDAFHRAGGDPAKLVDAWEIAPR